MPNHLVMQPSGDIPVAAGDVDGKAWSLRWTSDLGRMNGLRFMADDEFGSLAPGSDGAIAVNVLQARSVVWGLVDGRAVAVRVADDLGEALEAPVIGSDLDGAAAFVAVLPANREPQAIEVIGRDGGVLRRHDFVPAATGVSDVAARIDVRSVPCEPGNQREAIVARGRVDDATWEYTVNGSSTTIHTDFELRRADGGGGSSGGSGPAPRLDEGRRLRVGGTGASGDVWHLKGWADPTITRLVLRLRSGETLELPTCGRELALDVVAFAVALPGDVAAAVLDGYDVDDHRVARLHLAGHVGWIQSTMDEHRDRHARASAPVPAGVRRIWSDVFGVSFDEAASNEGPRAAMRELAAALAPSELEARWPIRPLLVPSTPRPAERWVLHGTHFRAEISQVVGVGLLWVGGQRLPDDVDLDDRIRLLAEAAIVLQQSLSWHDPEGERDAPNTSVRGRPAHLSELTVEVNNVDSIELSWQEPVTSDGIEPMTGVWCSVEANPNHHSVADLRRFIDELRIVD